MDFDDAALSPTQRHVLETLKRHGDATAEELAETLEISSSAVRQHLSALRSAGFITARQERGQAGRPADRYSATAVTERLFAPAGELAVELLDHLDEEDPTLVDRLFDRRRRKLVEAAKADLDGLSLTERVAALADELDARGYLADFHDAGDGHYLINLHGCAMWAVATRYNQACAAELGFLQDILFDATVQRVTHKTAGAHTCAYEITAKSSAMAATAGDDDADVDVDVDLGQGPSPALSG